MPSPIEVAAICASTAVTAASRAARDHLDRHALRPVQPGGSPPDHRPGQRPRAAQLGRHTIVHSDRGRLFRSHAYVGALRNAQLRGSKRRADACGGNAAMKSLFSLLYKNSLKRQCWATRTIRA
jgi:transposase InsO family protein